MCFAWYFHFPFRVWIDQCLLIELHYLALAHALSIEFMYMFHLCCIRDLDLVLFDVQENRQTALFSATQTKKVCPSLMFFLRFIGKLLYVSFLHKVVWQAYFWRGKFKTFFLRFLLGVKFFLFYSCDHLY